MAVTAGQARGEIKRPTGLTGHGDGRGSGGHLLANVDSLHILSDRPWGASRKMLRSPCRAHGLSERQRVKTRSELRVCSAHPPYQPTRSPAAVASGGGGTTWKATCPSGHTYGCKCGMVRHPVGYLREKERDEISCGTLGDTRDRRAVPASPPYAGVVAAPRDMALFHLVPLVGCGDADRDGPPSRGSEAIDDSGRGEASGVGAGSPNSWQRSCAICLPSRIKFGAAGARSMGSRRGVCRSMERFPSLRLWCQRRTHAIATTTGFTPAPRVQRPACTLSLDADANSVIPTR